MGFQMLLRTSLSKIFFIFVATFLSMTATASAQTGDSLKRHGDWQLNCHDKLCQIFSTLSQSKTGEDLLSASVLLDHKRNIVTIILRAPKRTALPPGLRFWVSKTSSAVIPFQYCDDEGCYATLQLEDGMRAEMTRVDRAVVEFIPYGSNKRTALPLSLNGFEKALGALRESLGK